VALAPGEVAVVVVVVGGDIAAVEGVIPGAGESPGTVADAPGAVVVVVVVAGAVAGLMTGAVAGDVAGAVAGDITGAVAGLVPVVGGAPGGLAGEVAGGGCPNEVSARVIEKRLAISVVFIGLIRKLSRPRIPMSRVSS
jgi:hypothetical protein